jgi:CheY-like chemotaxis protein
MPYILIIDDDEEFSGAIAVVLQSEGYEVDQESDPAAVLPRIAARRPDAVVLDVMFPESPTQGFDLARAIGKADAKLPILMLTAVNQQFPLGFSGKDIDPTWLPVAEFLEKPVDFRILAAKIAKLVGKERCSG